MCWLCTCLIWVSWADQPGLVIPTSWILSIQYLWLGVASFGDEGNRLLYLMPRLFVSTAFPCIMTQATKKSSGSNARCDLCLYVQHKESHDACQRNKAATAKSPGLLQPLQIPADRWQSVSMDIITQLPETPRGNSAIAVFVDRLTKMTHLAATKTSFTSKEFADHFLKEVFAKHGCLKDIVSDRDARFTSEFFQEVCQQLRVKQNMSTAYYDYHPQTDGQTERMNRVVEDMIRAYVQPSQMNWDWCLPLCEFSINNAYQDSIRISPFFLNYGMHSPYSDIVALAQVNDVYVQDMEKGLMKAKNV